MIKHHIAHNQYAHSVKIHEALPAGLGFTAGFFDQFGQSGLCAVCIGQGKYRFARGFAKTLTFIRVRSQRFKHIGQCAHVVLRHDTTVATIGHGFGKAGQIAGHHRKPKGKGFKKIAKECWAPVLKSINLA